MEVRSKEELVKFLNTLRANLLSAYIYWDGKETSDFHTKLYDSFYNLRNVFFDIDNNISGLEEMDLTFTKKLIINRLFLKTRVKKKIILRNLSNALKTYPIEYNPNADYDLLISGFPFSKIFVNFESTNFPKI